VPARNELIDERTKTVEQARYIVVNCDFIQFFERSGPAVAEYTASELLDKSLERFGIEPHYVFLKQYSADPIHPLSEPRAVFRIEQIDQFVASVFATRVANQNRLTDPISEDVERRGIVLVLKGSASSFVKRSDGFSFRESYIVMRRSADYLLQCAGNLVVFAGLYCEQPALTDRFGMNDFIKRKCNVSQIPFA
jgi:hypothetical protein